METDQTQRCLPYTFSKKRTALMGTTRRGSFFSGNEPKSVPARGSGACREDLTAPNEYGRVRKKDGRRELKAMLRIWQKTEKQELEPVEM